MKNVNSPLAFLFVLIFLIPTACGDGETQDPVIPPGQLILGIWTQTISKEEGVVQQKDEIFELNFMDNGEVLQRELDADDNSIVLDFTEDVWSLTDENSTIDFGFLDDLDILELTDSTLVVEYTGQNQIGQTILVEDTYVQD